MAGRGLCRKHYQRYRWHGRLDEVAPPVKRDCLVCGSPVNSRRWGAIYCSPRCHYKAKPVRKPRRFTNCEQCDAVLTGRAHQRFCSDACGDIWRNARTRERVLQSKVGRVCRGCRGPIDPTRMGKAFYCSDACKTKSRRHETYGLTKAELDLLLEQHAVCAVCRTDAWGKKGPQVDHDHQTGRVRGVLCGNCNQGLGRFRDDPVLLRRAAGYLSG